MKIRARVIHKGIQHIGAMLHCDAANELRVLFCHLGINITLDTIYYPLAPYRYPVSIGTGWVVCPLKYVRSLR